jgi:hypothetical protein
LAILKNTIDQNKKDRWFFISFYLIGGTPIK